MLTFIRHRDGCQNLSTVFVIVNGLAWKGARALVKASATGNDVTRPQA